MFCRFLSRKAKLTTPVLYSKHFKIVCFETSKRTLTAFLRKVIIGKLRQKFITKFSSTTDTSDVNYNVFFKQASFFYCVKAFKVAVFIALPS